MDSIGPVQESDITLRQLAGDIARIETVIAGWDEGPRDAAFAYRRAIDALHAEALRRLVRSLRADVAAQAALRAAVTDEIVYAVLRHHGLVKPSLAERVEAALEGVRPLLAGHGGDVELVRVEPPVLTVRFTGACDNCPASSLTIDAAVKAAVTVACPEITEVVQDRGRGERAA
jgi:Fe-S cluster biogenesis protein NfuA